MILIEHILGNIGSDNYKSMLSEDYTHDILILEQWEAQKSRCRKKSVRGGDFGLALDRDIRLTDGDVLHVDKQSKYILSVQIKLRDVMVVSLGKFEKSSFENVIGHVFELGHALGNQHWKAVIKNSKVYVPLTVEMKMMNSVMKTHGYDSDEYKFVSGSKILPLLTPSESRLLFGGAEDTHVHVNVENQQRDNNLHHLNGIRHEHQK